MVSRGRWTAALLFAIAHVGGGCAGGVGSDDVVIAPEPRSLEPGEEIVELCASFNLENQDDLYVQEVRMQDGLGFHHSNWLYVPEDQYQGPDGYWPCEERKFHPAAAAVRGGGLIFAQSTQAREESQAFPAGTAVKIPARSRIVVDLHLLNASADPLSVEPTLELITADRSEVQISLAALSLDNQALSIPPHARSEFAASCDLGERHRVETGRALDFRIYYVMGHYHDLGRRFALDAVRESGEVEPIVALEPRTGEQAGGALAEPYDLIGFEGLRWRCTYENPREETVQYGFGDQEMCVLFAFVDSELAWGGGIYGDDIEPVDQTAEGIARYQSLGCTVGVTLL